MKHLNFLAVLLLCSIMANGHIVIHTNRVSPSVKKLTDSIAANNMLHSASVGLMGARTEQYKRYEQLQKSATTEELRALTDNNNAVVRCYAFQALVARKKTGVFAILVISNKEKETIDSILVFDDRICLNAKAETIKHLAPEKRYYNRLRELFLAGHNEYAIIPLSKYKKQCDTALIRSLLRDNVHLARYYGLWAIRNFPDKTFFPSICDIHNDAISTRGKVDPMTMRMLYQAIVQYQDIPSRKLIEKTLATVKGNARNTHIENIWIALSKYHYNVYNGLLEQLNISDEEKQSLSYDLSIEG